MMREAWQALGHPAPVYKNDRSRKAFDLFIPELDKEVDMASDLMKAMFGETPPTPDKHPTSTRQVAGEVTGEVADEVTGEVIQLLKSLAKPKTRAEIQTIIGLKGQANFRDRYLKPALENGFIEMMIPEKPRSSKQKYRLTAKGRAIVEGPMSLVPGQRK